MADFCAGTQPIAWPNGVRRPIMRGMDRHMAFAEFLRSRRAKLQPEQIGAPAVLGRRRTPGLRREEVAQLAGVSVDYYARLEQGRKVEPSMAVLNALAQALRLDEAERGHLFALASIHAPAVKRTAERVRPGVLRLLETLTSTPAFVLGRRMDILAWNPMAARLLGDFSAVPASRRNMLWMLFLDPSTKSVYVDWPAIAKESIAHLRATGGRHPDDPMIAELVEELCVKSAEFRQWWSNHDVLEKGHGRKNLRHPELGLLGLDYETLQLHDGDDQVLVTYTAEVGSASQASLDLLAVLARADDPASHTRSRGAR
jgi:transcriptional regulator with XRE-family HTH domain